MDRVGKGVAPTAPLTWEETGVSKEEFEIIVKAAVSNPYWFEAFICAAEIQANRRAKYSGADVQKDDPYQNFQIVANLRDMSVRDVLKFYMSIKFARIMVGDEDHDDERYEDTLLDLANYALLAAGHERRPNAPR